MAARTRSRSRLTRLSSLAGTVGVVVGVGDPVGPSLAVGVAVGCLLAAGAGAVVIHGAYVDPGTQQQQRTVDEWRASGAFAHSATVVDAEGTLFETGVTLRNRSAYLSRVAPVLSGEFRFRTPGADAPLNLTVERRLVVESTSGDAIDGEPTVYWRETRSLRTNRTTKPPDESARFPFAVNVSRTVAEARDVSDRLDSPGTIRTRVEVSVSATRQTDNAVTRALSYSLPVETDGSVYRVGDGGGAESFADRETATVPREPGPLERLGGPLALSLGLAGLAAVGGARSRGLVPLSAAEREWLAYRADRADYDEWVTTIRLPDEARQLPTARAETLADLVAFAIDTDSGVTGDPDANTYHVRHDGYRYVYEPPTRSVDPPAADEATGDDRPTDADEPVEAATDRPDPLAGEVGDGDAPEPDETDDEQPAPAGGTDPLASDDEATG